MNGLRRFTLFLALWGAGTFAFGEVRVAEIRDVTLTHEGKVPDGTRISIETRSGATPRPGRSWSDWQPVPHHNPFRRFMQWRAILTTAHPLKTPELSRVTVQTRHEVIASAEQRGMELVEIESSRILRSSYRYGFQAPSRKLRKLRKKFGLEKIVESGETDLEKLILLRNWVRRQWPGNDGFGGRWDALEILEAPEGGKGMCVHFANLFSQCALALGFCARPDFEWSVNQVQLALAVSGKTDTLTATAQTFGASGFVGGFRVDEWCLINGIE